MKFEINVPDGRIADMLVGAFEGGSTYWCDSCRVVDKALNGATFIDGEDYAGMIYPHCLYGTVEITTDEEDGGRKFFINRDTIAKGLQVMAEKEPRHFGDMMSENDDATTADVFLQCVVFGVVIFS